MNINTGFTDETVDELPQNGFRIIQNKKKFCFGIDAVLLASFSRVRDGDLAADLCSGNGIVPFLMVSGTRTALFHAVEIQEECAELARRSVLLNGLEDRIKIFCADLKNSFSILEKNTYDVVTCNPPYMKLTAEVSEKYKVTDARAVARHELLCTLEDVVRCSAGLLKSGGRFYMIHKPFRLAEIFCTLKKYSMEPKRMRLVCPYAGTEPSMILVEAVKCAGESLSVQSSLVVYESAGVYTREVAAMYERQ